MSAQGPRLAHVVLQTGLPESLAQFYAEILNAHVVLAGVGLMFLTWTRSIISLPSLRCPTEWNRRIRRLPE
ncbi:hypothetical protein [Mycolicibacterium mageritense]|uniref:hypothetical protein n=1 Tax=Mycolicibacterium mageritense TaxID=53462 RepID=UPI001E614B80|nr:hypothetical protein [Mycolicibacterium mageritense]MCC9180613.1 hypothetical protein [Mycolicibacterium mageritense]GJJ20682.1 hypothetical protein MTY414_43550 [Mycolicibacterium mageritense]